MERLEDGSPRYSQDDVLDGKGRRWVCYRDGKRGIWVCHLGRKPREAKGSTGLKARITPASITLSHEGDEVWTKDAVWAFLTKLDDADLG